MNGLLDPSTGQRGQEGLEKCPVWAQYPQGHSFPEAHTNHLTVLACRRSGPISFGILMTLCLDNLVHSHSLTRPWAWEVHCESLGLAPKQGR